MELKTLKDMKKINEWEGFEGHVEVKELKAEAVKWYKHLEKVTGYHDAFDFIQTFFNLTEEDLKEDDGK